jgi:hypothetical protein
MLRGTSVHALKVRLAVMNLSIAALVSTLVVATYVANGWSKMYGGAIDTAGGWCAYAV